MPLTQLSHLILQLFIAVFLIFAPAVVAVAVLLAHFTLALVDPSRVALVFRVRIDVEDVRVESVDPGRHDDVEPGRERFERLELMPFSDEWLRDSPANEEQSHE